MKLKCVGGAFDDREVLPGEDIYVFHTHQPIILSDLNATLDATTKVEAHYYTPRYLGVRDQLIVRYAAPQDWTDVQAIRHQFAKGAVDVDKLRARIKGLEEDIREVITITDRNPTTAALANILKSILARRLL